MENSLLSVMIVDDEAIVREGLKAVIDWKAHGFFVCTDAASGEEAIEKIKEYNPELVLLDIRMPNMDGIEFIEIVRRFGYKGDFIILSGYSDFNYAQSALNNGALFYLTKPIDEEALAKAVISVKDKILKTRDKDKALNQYLKKAKETVLRDLLQGSEPNESINYLDMGLYNSIYQIVIYGGFNPFFTTYSFADILKVTNQGNNSFEHIKLNNQDIILLKGNHALNRFNDCLTYFKNGTQKGSPLDTIFLTYGRIVHNLNEIGASYQDCRRLYERRFFCSENQHILSYEALPEISSYLSVVSVEKAQLYSKRLVNYIETKSKSKVSEVLNELEGSLFTSGDDIIKIKHFLVDIFLQTKLAIMHKYNHIEIPFAHNSVIMELIENKFYLCEIIQYFSEQFEMSMRAIGSTSNEYIFDDIINYIEHNYWDPIKLEDLAELFGYNSSYLGKLFMQKMKQSFNSYLDEVRIKHSVELLENTDLKVYAVATKVGYCNVNYFHYKFKKLRGLSPAEYRKGG